MKPMAFVVFCTLLALSPRRRSHRTRPKDTGEDPLLGTWHLDIDKSTYRPGPRPKSQTRTYEKHRFGIKATVKTLYADGRSTTVHPCTTTTERSTPVTGSEEIDAIVVKRVDAYTHEATLTHGSQETGTFRRVISKDGKHMTVTFKRRNPPADYVGRCTKSRTGVVNQREMDRPTVFLTQCLSSSQDASSSVVPEGGVWWVCVRVCVRGGGRGWSRPAVCVCACVWV